MSKSNNDFVEMTEFVRFNGDGSSDHIRVVGAELVGEEHYDPSPYLVIDSWPPVPAASVCNWIVEVTRTVKS